MQRLPVVIALLLLCGCRAASVDCRSSQPVEPDWPDHVVPAGGWNYVRQPHMDRSIWFCTSSDEATWERLGTLAGLDPREHGWWAQDADGGPALETKPALGKRYTLPNRVYIVMGGASMYNPFTPVPYVGSAFAWLVDFPQTVLAPATRPIGKAIVFRPEPPLQGGYKVTKIQNLHTKDLAGIVKGPDTWGLVYFGHGNTIGVTTFQTVHAGFVMVFDIRNRQHHLMGKTLLNSCSGNALAEQLTSPTGCSRGHVGFYQPPFGSFYW